MKNILIVGASGLIGSKLILAFGKKYNTTLLGHRNTQNRNIISLDLTKNEYVDNFSKDCPFFDSVIFLVGLAHKKGKKKDLNLFKKINYTTLVNLLTSLEKYNKTPGKIIFASTISVYGEKVDREIYLENSKKSPISPYAITKLMAESFLIEKYHKKAWILRFSPVYSKNFRLNIDRRTKIKNMFYCIGDGSSQLSLCNINNITNATLAIINDEVPFGSYNISDPISYTYRTILNTLGAKIPLKIPVFFVKILYFLGKSINNIFLIENSIKLFTNNVYSSEKIQNFVKLKHQLVD